MHNWDDDDDDDSPWADCEACGQVGDHGVEGCPADLVCAFPDECLMPGPHLRDECHTVEMMEAWEEEQGITPAAMDAKLAHLVVLWVAPASDAQQTARDDGEAWWIQDWETIEISGETYWQSSGGYRLEKSVVQRLAQGQER
jgi:hypothetical protein